MELVARPEAPLIVIVGPTASGKTSLAIKIAKMHRGEVICADSRTIYAGMDIGTAKPTLQEREGVSHWGLDLVEPDERFTAADFQRYARDKIREIRARGNVPIIVGGTGLYVDSVLFSYEFGDKVDEKKRRQLEALSIEDLKTYCINNNIKLPENHQNKRYVIRAIEQEGVNDRRKKDLLPNTVVVGISTDRALLRTRIAYRIEQMLHNGVVEEAKILGKKYGWDTPAMTGNIYSLVKQYTSGQLSLQELQYKAEVRDWHLAKRQLTWSRRNPAIQWHSQDAAYRYLRDTLAPWRSS